MLTAANPICIPVIPAMVSPVVTAVMAVIIPWIVTIVARPITRLAISTAVLSSASGE